MKNIEKIVDKFPTKNKEGFTRTEMEELVKQVGVDKRKFNKALGVNTCIIIGGEVITYHSDIISALRQVITNKPQNPAEWD